MVKKKKGKSYIGTSGWHYKHWMGTFYPAELKPKDFIYYYLKFFRTLEINNSFYRLPNRQTFENWKKQVPPDFVFAVKASRYITHMKKLKDPHQPLADFLQNAQGLEEKLGPILFQLPPGWKLNIERFEEFLEALPKGLLYTFEFRNHSWYDDNVLQLLEKYKCAFCIYELEFHMSPIEVTTDFIYVRLHGPSWKYSGSYSDSKMEEWAHKCLEWNNAGKNVYFYFDNDQLGYAAFNAITLKEMIENNLKLKS